MQPFLFKSSAQGGYHDHLLIAKVRDTGLLPALGMRAAMAMPAEAAAVSSSLPGLSALATFSRAGLVRRVMPLSRAPDVSAAVAALPRLAGAPERAVMALAAAAAPPRVAADADANHGVSLIEVEPGTDTQQLRLALAADPSIEFVNRVPIRYLLARRAATPRRVRQPGASVGVLAVPPAASTMWNLRKIRWEAARALAGFVEATAIDVAVLDTGVDAQHPDLIDNIISYEFNDRIQPGRVSDQDIIGHGTHVSGTIAAGINNDVGINGVCDCRLSVWKIFDDEPARDPIPSSNPYYPYYVDPALYQQALADCVRAKVKVINLSIGGPAPLEQNEADLFRKLEAQGTVVCAAMGNSGPNGPAEYPGAVPGVIAVAAMSNDDSIADFSTWGPHAALSAPGAAIWSTLPRYAGQSGFRVDFDAEGRPRRGKPIARETNYDAWFGTSMATPHVTAAVALLLAKTPGLTPADVREKVMNTADKVAQMGNASRTDAFGSGRLNLLRLLTE